MNESYLNAFIEETREHLQSLNEHLLALEQSAQDEQIISSIFRSAHTIKGMAATMGFEQMAHLTHELENGLDKVRHGEVQVTSEMMDVLFSSVDLLEAQLAGIVESGTDQVVDVGECVQRLIAVAGGAVDNLQPAPEAANQRLLEYTDDLLAEANHTGQSAFIVEVLLEPDSAMRGVRAFMVVRALEQLGDIVKSQPSGKDLEEGNFEQDFLLLMVTDASAEDVRAAALNVSEVIEVRVVPVSHEEVISPKPSGPLTDPDGHQGTDAIQGVPQKSSEKNPAFTPTNLHKTPSPTGAAPLAENGVTPGTSLTGLQKNRSIRVDVERLDALMNLFSEFVIDKTRVELLAKQIDVPELSDTVQHLSRVGTDLQGIVMKMRMVSVATVFNRFPRMVRDLAKTLDKKVEFAVSGAETELDRTLVEEIADPLVHILRNALDHGMEHPAERVQAGKAETGTIHLTAYQAGNHVFIEVQDDGQGIDRTKVLTKAASNGLIDPLKADSMSDEQVFGLLFETGFSTAETVTDVSGRGVGLDAARAKIRELGGDILVESRLGQGSKFVLQLPLTLSIIEAMLIRIGKEPVAVPLNSVLQIEQMLPERVAFVQGKPTLDFRGRIIPLLDLRARFAVPGDDTKPSGKLVAVFNKGDKLVGGVIDEVIGQREIVVKTLGKHFGEIPGIAGATILGDGQVALILDPNALFR